MTSFKRFPCKFKIFNSLIPAHCISLEQINPRLWKSNTWQRLYLHITPYLTNSKFAWDWLQGTYTVNAPHVSQLTPSKNHRFTHKRKTSGRWAYFYTLYQPEVRHFSTLKGYRTWVEFFVSNILANAISCPIRLGRSFVVLLLLRAQIQKDFFSCGIAVILSLEAGLKSLHFSGLRLSQNFVKRVCGQNCHQTGKIV